ncbi:MAG: cobyrinate a,c-diamide synthase [Mariprofundales bacterium]|nr:cobyrinate a,c-diamide synthase [Mariprofundales bacterium]
MLIAGTQSGCGKTTITLALMQALRARGLVVAPFKAGPDFLDPMWHTAACNRPCYNLDSRMMGEAECRRLRHEKSTDADLAIIEGVMGLFDGASGVGGVGSAADLARVLEEDVLLTVNAKGMGGSIVPLVEGFVRRAKQMGVRIVGIIANWVGSTHHAELLGDLLHNESLPPLVAWMEKDAPELAERHLGLVMPDAGDMPDLSRYFHMQQDFTAEARRRGEDEISEESATAPLLHDKKIAIAQDAAFCFIYAANLEWLQQQGAEITFFSPLAGESVPENTDAVWLPGGYPELHLKSLGQSSSWQSIRELIEDDKPLLAECGGMMVLGATIDGVPMANLLPFFCTMQSRLAGLGYREEANGALGHEFHHSKREDLFTTEAQRHGEVKAAFQLDRGDHGLRYRNLRASYIHWYFPSQPQAVASWFRT